MVLRVAITGGIACGKSLFTRHLQRLGAEVLDADAVVHALEGAGGEAVQPIRTLFGESVIKSDGSVDRVRLGEAVFRDQAARERLNAVVHPLVRERVAAWLRRPGEGVRVVDVPLLFEAGWASDWDVIICVVSDETAQVGRLMRSRGLSDEQARARIAAQMPVADKAARAHWVVNNDAGADALAQKAEETYRLLRERLA